MRDSQDNLKFISSATSFPDGFFMQKHKPIVMNKTHNHNHVEIMLPVRCAIHFATHAGQAVANDTELCMLWGQLPHRVTEIEGDGLIYIANMPLQEILSLDMPDDVLESLLSGQLVTAQQMRASDAGAFEGWVKDYENGNRISVALARTELQCRLRRQTLEGWQLMRQNRDSDSVAQKRNANHMGRIQRMIRFMAEHYTQPISVSDIAASGGVSDGYAMGLFQKSLGVSITAYLTKLRLYHAKSALLESDEKILTIAMDSGFGSLSRFYEVFTKQTGNTPQAYRQQQSFTNSNL